MSRAGYRTHRANILPIPGTSRLAHLEANLAAADLVRAAEDLAELAAAQPEPGGMPP
jgi:aryl-alcohol dehydrogenase-like predicted oxidoreductase